LLKLFDFLEQLTPGRDTGKLSVLFDHDQQGVENVPNSERRRKTAMFVRSTSRT
jgi:hypothetical protein